MTKRTFVVFLHRRAGSRSFWQATSPHPYDGDDHQDAARQWVESEWPRTRPGMGDIRVYEVVGRPWAVRIEHHSPTLGPGGWAGADRP